MIGIGAVVTVGKEHAGADRHGDDEIYARLLPWVGSGLQFIGGGGGQKQTVMHQESFD